MDAGKLLYALFGFALGVLCAVQFIRLRNRK